MSNYKRRAMLGSLALLSLLAGLFTPVPLPGDNYEASAQSPGAPDLIIESIYWWPEVPAIGSTATFTVTIRNLGESWTEPFRHVYYIDDEIASSISNGGMSPNTSTVNYFTWKAKAGEHILRAVVDHDSEVAESNEDNNERTYAFSVLAPDLIVDDITLSPENPSVGDDTTFSIRIKNRGNKRAGVTNVGLVIDGHSHGYRPIPILEPGDNSTIDWQWTAMTGSHNFQLIADFLNQVKESDEDNNTRVVTYATPTPDLTIDSITYSPVNRTATGNVTFTATISNQGSGTSGVAFLAFCVDNVWEDTVSVTQLGANATTTKTFSYLVGVDSHAFKLVIDASEDVTESDETNNTLEVTLPAIAPDLIVYSITCSPTQPLKAHKMVFNITVKNQGTRPAELVDVYLYVNEAFKLSSRLSSISADGTATAVIPWLTSEDSVNIRIVIDEDNRIFESNESNNEMTKTVTFVNPSPEADLIIQDVTCTPANPSIGDTVTITSTIKNQGSGLASPSHVAYYIDDILVQTVYINQINAGATATNNAAWNAAAGAHTIKAIADYNGSIYETNEANNEMTTALQVFSPDLVIQRIDWSPAIPTAGDEVTFTLTVINRGNLKTEASYVSYYVDGIYRGNHNIENIDPGSTVTKTFNYTFLADSHTFKAILDKADELMESDESNNERTVSFPTPDLTIEWITWSPAEPSENCTVTFGVTVRNTGDGPTDSSYLDCYIDDTLQERIPMDSIASGATAAGSFAWDVTSGEHVFKAIADGSDRVTETDETNNEKTINLPFPGEPVEVIPEPESPAEAAIAEIPETEQPEAFVEVEEAVIEIEDDLPADNATGEPDIASNISEEPSTGWRDIIMNKFIIIGGAALGLLIIVVLLILRRRSRNA